MSYVTDREHALCDRQDREHALCERQDRDHAFCDGQGPCLMCDVTVSVAAEVGTADGGQEGEVKEQPLPRALRRGRVCQRIVCLGECVMFTLKHRFSRIKVLQIFYYN